MRINRLEEIIVWQKVKNLTNLVYQEFEAIKDFEVKNQTQRLCVSIMKNIAEGFEQKSNKIFKHFLIIAQDSFKKVRMLSLAKDLEKSSEQSFNEKYKLTKGMSKKALWVDQKFINFSLST